MTRPTLPQLGGCLCGDVRYELADAPLSVYACHCTHCQRQTGSGCSISVLIPREALRIVRGDLDEYAIELEDGCRKRAQFCARCCTRVCAASRTRGLAIVEAGTLDDTSWIRPVAHTFTRSAQPWVVIPEAAIRVEGRPSREEMQAFVRAWKERARDGGP